MIESGNIPPENNERHEGAAWQQDDGHAQVGFQGAAGVETYMTVSDAPPAEVPQTAAYARESDGRRADLVMSQVEKLPVLPLAEQMDPAVLRRMSEQLLAIGDESDRGKGRMAAYLSAASTLGELGLATPDDAEAADAFGRSRELLLSSVEHLPPENWRRLRAERSAGYVPVMAMRRAGAEPEAIAAAAYAVLAESLGRLLPLCEVEGDSPNDPVRQAAIGMLAEDSVAALLARDGEPPFISSEREGNSGAPGELLQASDFHLIEGGSKVRVEVKYKHYAIHRKYDTAQLVIVRYLSQVCTPIINERFRQPGRPANHEVGMQIAGLLEREGSGAGRPDNPHDRYLLDRGSELVKNRINEWKHDHPQPQ